MRMIFLQTRKKSSVLLQRILALLLIAFISSINSFGQISIGPGVALVNPPSGGFNINGALLANSASGDWLDGSGSGGYVLNANGTPINSTTTFHSIDLFGNGDNIFVGGLKKNDNPNNMGWKAGSPSPAKCDINNFMMHISKTTDGHTWITLAGDRQSVSGNSFISLALHQNTLTLGEKTFISEASNATGGRTPGDVQVSAEFTGGGSNPNLYLEEWKLVGSSYVWAPITIPAGIIVAYGKTNSSTISGITFPVFGGTQYQANSFIEVSFDITEIYENTATPCVGSIKSMLVLTKSSQSLTADLADFVSPIQVDLNINVGPPTASGANYCVGQNISALTATGTNGTIFKWYTTVDGNGKPTGTGTTGASYTPTINNTIPGTYNYYVTQTLDGCESTPRTVTVNVVSNPTIFTLSGNSICSSDGNTGLLTLSSSQSGVSYQLKKSSDNSTFDAAKPGTGSALEWTGVTPNTSYYVEATGATPTSCKTTTSGASVTLGETPTVYTLTGNSICASAPNTGVLTLSNSQSGVSYQLKKTSDNTPVQDSKAGTGSALEWTGLAAGVNYYVEATGASPTNCKSITSNAAVTQVANPIVYTLSGNSICASSPNTGVITLSNSQSGVSYQLKKTSDNSTVQTSKAGTGSPLEWTGLAAVVNYFVEATGAAPTSCNSVTGNASITEVANPTVFTLSGSAICSAEPNTGVISLNNSQTGVTYQLIKAADDSHVQASKEGTGSAINWTGLPSGIDYYVEATGGSPTSCKSTTTNASVTESANPSQPLVNIVNPTCSTATGTITVTSPLGSSFEYSYNDGPYGESAGPFTFNAGAGYKIEVKNKTSGCISVPQECNAQITIASPSTLDVIETKAVIQGSRSRVLAAPNPFNDRVKFTLESAVSGLGSLEIYNSLGQRVSVVFQGYVEAGKPQVKEFTVPTVQRSMLIYVFRVGNERVTGKLISNR